MASRAEMIRSARDRVDARRDARRADIRDNYRRTYSQNLGKTKLRPTKQRVGNLGNIILGEAKRAGNLAGTMTKDIVLDPAKKGINQFKDAILPFGQKVLKGIEALGSNIDRSSQNRKILGDEYTDDLRKSMMSDSDREYYEKYRRLGDMRSGQEAQYYYDQANTALQNAQITNRINYALGQPELGFKTTAPTGQESFFGDENIDYSTLADRMVHGTDDSVGLAGTATGKAFMAEAMKAANKAKGSNDLISNKMSTYAPPENTFEFLTKGAHQYPKDADTQDVSEYNIPPELFIDESQNMTDVFNDYGGQGMNDKALMDTMGAFYEGASAGSPYDTGARSPLHGIYPNYESSDEPSIFGLENMSEQELLDWGLDNPIAAKTFGFNPNYSNMWHDY